MDRCVNTGERAGCLDWMPRLLKACSAGKTLARAYFY